MSAASFETVVTPSASSSMSGDSLTSIPCNICRRQFSRYICPKCNIPYCSLTCFRSETHSECSESFYKKELETQIKSEPSKSVAERRKMMEMLQRFEEESAEDVAVLEGDESDDLANRLDSLDLEHADYDDIWSALTPAEREKFITALEDPKSDLAQRLLASEELETQVIEPWWERSHYSDAERSSAGFQELIAASGRKRHGRRPPPLSVPQTIISGIAESSANGPSLLYNISAVLVAYAFATRHFSTSPLAELQAADQQAARETLSRLVPFLVDRKSKTVFPTLSGMVTDVWSRFTPGAMTAKPFSVLLRDASKLLRPVMIKPLAVTTSSSAEPDRDQAADANVDSGGTEIPAVMGDIASLFSIRSSHTPAPKETSSHISHKLTFYAAHALATPTSILHLLATEVAAQADLVEREGGGSEGRTLPGQRHVVIDEEQRRAGPRGGAMRASSAFIEELT